MNVSNPCLSLEDWFYTATPVETLNSTDTFCRVCNPQYKAICKDHVKNFGTWFLSDSIKENVPDDVLMHLSLRHLHLDWGSMDKGDKEQNWKHFLDGNGMDITSVYEEGFEGKPIWITTSGYGNDPSNEMACRTTIYFPEER